MMKDTLIQAVDSGWAFYAMLILALITVRIPVAGKYFRLVATMVHEAAHAFTAFIFSGEIIAVNLFADASGTTITKSKNKASQALVAFAGYPLTSLTALLFLYLLQQHFEKYILFILLSLVMLLVVLFVRNTFGLVWSISFMALNIGLLYFENQIVNYYFIAFYCCSLLAESFLSTLVLLRLSYKNSKKAGDASNLAKITGIPAIIWAFLFFGIAVVTLYLSIIYTFPNVNSLLS